MVPLTEAVHLPFFTQYINAEGQFVASEISIQGGKDNAHRNRALDERPEADQGKQVLMC